VNRMCDMGLAGAECLVGIPGSMGGATAMNAGGRHGWLSHIATRVKFLAPDGSLEELAKTDSMFAYRSSIFGDCVVVETVIALEAGDPALIRAKRTEILKEKGAAQPLKQKSAGCIFKNPEGGSAGRLIEAAGLKGLRKGAAEISPKHGNFIVNHGGARFADIVDLAREARRVVFDRFGVTLEREVKVWSREPLEF
jgi:UDP-N-acetylmuramate dehydrogenase